MYVALFIDIFVALESFLLGVLATELYLHSKAVVKPDAVIPSPVAPVEPPMSLPPAVRDQLIKETETDYEAMLKQSVAKFDQDLSKTSGTINEQIKGLATDVVGKELDEYRQQLAKLRETAMSTMSSVQSAVDKERAEQEAQLAKDIAAEKERLVKQIDSKLNDAVSSFLIETLQHNVDLGAQNAYLMSMLDEHKDELKKEVANDA